MRKRGVRFTAAWGRQAFKIGGKFKFWGGLTVEAVGGGPGLVESLTQIAKKAGIEILYGARALSLVSDDSGVHGVTVASICMYGLVLVGTNDSVSQSTIVRSVLWDGGGFGISVVGSGGHRVRQNEVVGTVSAGGSAIGIFVCSPGNLIEENNVSGNGDAGIALKDCTATYGNIIRRNIVFGNIDWDIIGNPGTDTFDNNACEVFGGLPPGTPSPCPNLPSLAGHQNP